MNSRKEFLEALATNEDNASVRQRYAEWLDTQHEYDEADRQRRWPAAKKWIVEFCEEHGSTSEYDTKLGYEELIAAGLEALGGNRSIQCGSNEDMCDALRQHSDEFWAHWSTITGIYVSTNDDDYHGFSCAC